MDLTTLIGLIFSGILMVYGIGVDKLGNFIDVQSIFIVVGGTLAALIASYPFGILKEIPKHIRVLFRGKQYSIPPLIDQLFDKPGLIYIIKIRLTNFLKILNSHR